MFSLANKVAVVTGGASGIGKAIAERFLKAGACVYSIDLAKTTADGAVPLVGDVSDEAELRQLFEDVAAQAGRIDILINNAAIQPLGIPFAELTEHTLRRTFEVNVHGVAFGIKHGPSAIWMP